MTGPPDYYAILGLSRDASAEDIRHAYHRAARIIHPDANPHAGATEDFLRLQAAFEVLSDPKQKAAYDRLLPAESSHASPVNVQVAYSRFSLSRLREAQLIYCLVELSAPQGASLRSSPPLNLCLVVDRSTSMQGERMDTVKCAALDLLHHLKPPDLLSIISFNDRAETLLLPTPVEEISVVESKLRLLHPGGGTEIFRGLEAGLFAVRSKYSDDYTNQMIMLTDGRTYGDEAACLRLAEEAAHAGIGISVLGIGDAWNDAFLDQLVSITGGVCLYISKTIDLKHFLTEKIKGLGQTYAERVTLDLRLAPGVAISYACRLAPDAQPLNTTLPMRLGFIPKTPKLALLLELTVQPIQALTADYTMAQGEIQLNIPSMFKPEKKLPIRFWRPVTDSNTMPPPPTRILQAISRLNLYRMQESAQQCLSDGDYGNASRYLQNLSSHLFAQGEHQLARAVLKEAENLDNHAAPSEASKKEIKFKTRALLLPAPSNKIHKVPEM